MREAARGESGVWGVQKVERGHGSRGSGPAAATEPFSLGPRIKLEREGVGDVPLLLFPLWDWPLMLLSAGAYYRGYYYCDVHGKPRQDPFHPNLGHQIISRDQKRLDEG